MAHKPKAGSPKKSAKSKEKTQRERFIETARAIGVDETGREFEAAITKMLKPKTGS
jgi:hypothetical protein